MCCTEAVELTLPVISTFVYNIRLEAFIAPWCFDEYNGIYGIYYIIIIFCR